MMLLEINSNWNSPIDLRTYKLMKMTPYKLPTLGEEKIEKEKNIQN